jgi:hypothetical protein
MTEYIDHTNAGAKVDIDDEAKAQWMLDNGYISKVTPSKAKDAGDRGVYVTSPPADQDPTLAENREKPAEPKPHVANGDDEGQSGETVHGRNMGLDAEPVADSGPKVEVKTGKANKGVAKVADA